MGRKEGKIDVEERKGNEARWGGREESWDRGGDRG